MPDDLLSTQNTDFPASISKQKPEFPAYLNFQQLRDVGIRHLQALSGDLWTDYNLHDPGVTILEVLCYAITDLGYRNNLDIDDLLALNPADQNSRENNFFTLDEVLTCNPVTELDLRKRLIDIAGVRNVQFEKVGVTDPQTGEIRIPYAPAIEVDIPNSRLQYSPPDASTQDNTDTTNRLQPRGLYTVRLDLDSQYRKNACGQLYHDWSKTLDEVKSVLCSYRNLCEDVYDIVLLGEEEIGLCADLQLETNADAEDVLVDVYVRIQEFLSPRLRFYTLQELLKKGKSPAEIFAGRPMAVKHPQRPYSDRNYTSHGFIDTDELAALTPPTILHTSDLYQEILNVPGVAAVKKLSIANYINGLRQSQGHPWYLHLTDNYRPVLGLQYSKVRFFKDELPIPVNEAEVTRRYHEQQAAYIKTPRDPYELDQSVPQGRYYDLADHYSIHHEFPLNYGISEDGLPDNVSAFRKAQALQLKGYLVFFDQILASYLSQLTHLRDLFSWDIDSEQEPSGYTQRPQKQQTYFHQAIDFPGVDDIIKEFKDETYLEAIGEDATGYRDRRNRFLDHLLARFAESFTDYVLLNYRIFETHRDKEQHEANIIRDKARFLQEYPILSHDRFRACNYCDCNAVWDTDNVSGFQKRVSRLLGIQDVRRRNLNHYKVEPVSGVTLSIHCIPQDTSQRSPSDSLENSSSDSSPETFQPSRFDPPLISNQIYEKESDALAVRDTLLHFALHADFYQRLTYRFFYQYGWEVRFTLEDEPITLRYDRYFASRLDRRNALNPLLETLQHQLSEYDSDSDLLNNENIDENVDAPTSSPTPPPETFITIQSDAEGLLFFQLSIPANSSNPEDTIHFTGQERYFSHDRAFAAAVASLYVIKKQEAYCPVLLRDEATEGGDDMPRQIPYYGYALTDQDGKGLVESADWVATETERNLVLQRFQTEAERDLALQRWLCHIEANQNEFEFVVEHTANGWVFLLQDLATPRQTLLRSFTTYETNLAAWKVATTAATRLRNLSAYVSSVQDETGQRYSLGIVDSEEHLLMVSDTDLDRVTTFKQLNNVDAWLRFDPVTTPNKPTTYRFRLVDRQGVTVLQSIQSYSDETTARDRFYLDVLGVLFEPAVICPTQTCDGYSFRTLSQPRNRRSEVTLHPQVYETASERDWAIEQVLVLIRTARFTIAVQSLASDTNRFVGQIYNGANQKLLQGLQFYSTEKDAWEHGNPLMELIQNRNHFRTIDGDNGLHGWELTNPEKDQVLARAYYTSEQEREQAIDELQRWVNDEGFFVLEHILLRPRTNILPALNESADDHSDSDHSNPEHSNPEHSNSNDSDSDNLTASHLSGNSPNNSSGNSPGNTQSQHNPFDDRDGFLPIYMTPDDLNLSPTHPTRLTRQDPYSFWITIVLPYWSERFRNLDFRRFIERTLRMEAPAHVALKIAWINVHQMHQFETAYRNWLEQLALEACHEASCHLTPTLNTLLELLPKLQSVYPKATLHHCDERRPDDSPILLNQTVLGTAKD